MNSSDWKSILGGVAPALATALGGPLAGAAVSALSASVLNKPNGSLTDIATAVSAGTPDVLEKILAADKQFKLDMERLGIDHEKLAADDRDSARNREIQVKDHTTRNLAYGALVCFLGVLGIQGYIALHGTVVLAEAQRTLDITLGVLFSWVLGVKEYYFGSSSGSSEKNALLKQALDK